MIKRIFLSVLFVAAISGPAKADTFVWKDPVQGFAVSFPDSWRIQTDDTANTRVRIAGPIAEDMASCKIASHPDGRALIYPKRLVDEAVVEKLGRDFWDAQTGELTNARISDYYAPASFGDRGDATAIRVAFHHNDGKGTMVPMYGIMIASLYGDKLYVGSCSARYEVYGRYSALFGSIIDSVALDERDSIFPSGYYRNFLADPKLILPRSKPGTVKENKHFWSNWFRRDEYHFN